VHNTCQPWFALSIWTGVTEGEPADAASSRVLSMAEKGTSSR